MRGVRDPPPARGGGGGARRETHTPRDRERRSRVCLDSRVTRISYLEPCASQPICVVTVWGQT